MKHAVAELIRLNRLASGLNVTDAADQAGLSRSKWSAVEAESPREQLPKADTLVNMARVAGARVGDVLRAAGHPDVAAVADAREGATPPDLAYKLDEMLTLLRELVATLGVVRELIAAEADPPTPSSDEAPPASRSGSRR